MRLPTLILLALASAAVLPGAASADVLVTIDKAMQRMNVSVDGQDRYSWAVSTGVPGHDTPSGSYTPFRMDRDHFSREWDDAPMPNSIFFTEMGHAIHGTGHVAALGRPASHGCVRLSRAHSASSARRKPRPGVKKDRASSRLVLPAPLCPASTTGAPESGRSSAG